MELRARKNGTGQKLKNYKRSGEFKITNEFILKTDMVMKMRTLTYHMACFTCSSCKKKLTIGEEFVLREREDDILCRIDCDTSNIEQSSSIKTNIYG